jgi:Spy/CpxP family protein refolding chaperone
MKRRILALVCAVVLTFGLRGLALAAHDDNDMSAKRENMEQKIDKELNLSAEQREQLKSFRADQQTVRQDIKKQLAEKRLAMKDELAKPESDKSIIDQLSADIKQLAGQGIDLHTAAMLKMKEVLTQEQFKKFLEIMEKRAKDMPHSKKDQ